MILKEDQLVVNLDDIDFSNLVNLIRKDLSSNNYKKYCIKDDNDVCYYDFVVICNVICWQCNVDFETARKVVKVLSDLELLKTTINNGDELYAV